MNWIEIDKILYNIIARHDNTADMFKEAQAQFKWSKSQAEAAIQPLLKRNTNPEIFGNSIKVVADAAKDAINKKSKGKR